MAGIVHDLFTRTKTEKVFRLFVLFMNCSWNNFPRDDHVQTQFRLHTIAPPGAPLHIHLGCVSQFPKHRTGRTILQNCSAKQFPKPSTVCLQLRAYLQEILFRREVGDTCTRLEGLETWDLCIKCRSRYRMSASIEWRNEAEVLTKCFAPCCKIPKKAYVFSDFSKT